MRNFGLEKQFILCRRCRAKTYVVPFDIKSHGSGAHPDLNMSEFSRLATKKEECLGKLLDFYSFNIEGGVCEHLHEGVLANRQKKRDIEKFESCSLAFLWGKCLSFCEKWKLWHLWPTYLPGSNQLFSGEKSKNTFQPSAFCHLLTCQLVKVKSKTLLGLLGFSSLVDKHPHLRHLNGVEKTGLQICGGMKGVFERIFWQNILIGWESLFSVKGDAANQIAAQKPVVLIADFQYYCRKILVKS